MRGVEGQDLGTVTSISTSVPRVVQTVASDALVCEYPTSGNVSGQNHRSCTFGKQSEEEAGERALPRVHSGLSGPPPRRQRQDHRPCALSYPCLSV